MVHPVKALLFLPLCAGAVVLSQDEGGDKEATAGRLLRFGVTKARSSAADHVAEVAPEWPGRLGARLARIASSVRRGKGKAGRSALRRNHVGGSNCPDELKDETLKEYLPGIQEQPDAPTPTCEDAGEDDSKVCKYLAEGALGCIYTGKKGNEGVAIKVIGVKEKLHTTQLLAKCQREELAWRQFADTMDDESFLKLHYASCTVDHLAKGYKVRGIFVMPLAAGNLQGLMKRPETHASGLVGDLFSRFFTASDSGDAVDDESTGGTGASQLNHIARADLLDIAQSVAKSLDTIHNAGYLHNDVKDENVLFFNDSTGTDRYKLADFGEACTEDEAANEKCREGTNYFFPPENCGTTPGPKSTKTDIWAFGVMMYRLAVFDIKVTPTNQQRPCKIEENFPGGNWSAPDGVKLVLPAWFKKGDALYDVMALALQKDKEVRATAAKILLRASEGAKAEAAKRG